MTSKKNLIVNADDFGQSSGINRGITEAHEHGIVASASLMTRWLAAGEAALYAQQYPKLSLGLHLDLGEWVCHGEAGYRSIRWSTLQDRSALEREVYRQVEHFRYLVGREPTHINSDQNVHLHEPLPALLRFSSAARLESP